MLEKSGKGGLDDRQAARMTLALMADMYEQMGDQRDDLEKFKADVLAMVDAPQQAAISQATKLENHINVDHPPIVTKLSKLESRDWVTGGIAIVVSGITAAISAWRGGH